jgi:hypothetical protein
MKRFFLKSGLFLLPLLLCYAVVEVKLAGLPNTYSQKRTDFEQQLPGIQILVLGPSHALHGIDPSRFSHAGYNLANASQTIYYDKELTLKYLDKLQSLKLVIIPISYNSLYTQLDDSKESFRCWFYSKYWGIESPGMARLDLRRYSNIALYTPQTTLEFLGKGFHVNLTEGLASNGYLKYDTAGSRNNISFTLGAKRVELYRRMMKEEHFAENTELLTQLVTTLRQRDIQVCFITIPVFKTFAKYCEPAVFESNTAALRDICSRHGCGYKNYFNDSRFTVSDFYDNDHLNFIGAARFSAILDSDVVSKVSF